MRIHCMLCLNTLPYESASPIFPHPHPPTHTHTQHTPYTHTHTYTHTLSLSLSLSFSLTHTHTLKLLTLSYFFIRENVKGVVLHILLIQQLHCLLAKTCPKGKRGGKLVLIYTYTPPPPKKKKSFAQPIKILNTNTGYFQCNAKCVCLCHPTLDTM